MNTVHRMASALPNTAGPPQGLPGAQCYSGGLGPMGPVGPHAHRGRPALHGVDGPLCRAWRGWGRSTVSPPPAAFAPHPPAFSGSSQFSLLFLPSLSSSLALASVPSLCPGRPLLWPCRLYTPCLPTFCWDTASAQRRPCFLPALSPRPRWRHLGAGEGRRTGSPRAPGGEVRARAGRCHVSDL